MAHHYESGFVGNNQPAWHNLAKVVNGTLKTKDAIIQSQLDWEVSLEDLWYEVDGVKRNVQDQFAVIRNSDKSCLGTVGQRYHPVQNHECFAFMDKILGQAEFDSCGSLFDGKKVFMLAKIKKELFATPTDVIYPYLLLSTSHDGSSCLTIQLTSIRVVCHNTLSLALGLGTPKYNVRHCKNSMKTFIENAIKKCNLAIATIEQQQEKISTLVHTKITDKQAEDYFVDVFNLKQYSLLNKIVERQQTASSQQAEIMAELLKGHEEQSQKKMTRDKNLLETVINIYHNEKNTAGGIEGTSWAALNAVTEYVDHEKSSRGIDNKSRNDNKFESAMFGKDNELKMVAMEKALALAI